MTHRFMTMEEREREKKTRTQTNGSVRFLKTMSLTARSNLAPLVPRKATSMERAVDLARIHPIHGKTHAK